MVVEIASKKNLISIVIDNEVTVERIIDKDIAEKRYYGLMYAIRRACALLRTKGVAKDDIVVFTTSNYTLKQWVSNGYPNKKYEEYFYVMLQELNSVPMRYIFTWKEYVEAYEYLSYDNVKKVEVSGLGVD